MRLDEYLVNNGYTKSRNKAKELIVNKKVMVDGLIIEKPSFEIDMQEVTMLESQNFVSRAGLKLVKAIEEFKIDFKQKNVLDVGASTGGFSDVSLKQGAKKVYAVDVGHGQLDASLLNDLRIVNLEKTNIKDINKDLVNDTIDIVVSDISFISSKFMFAAIKKLNLAKQCDVISLIKPQFELTPQIVAKHKGKITEAKYINEAIEKVKKYAIDNDFKIMGLCESPIKGAKKENQEYLIWCKYDK